MFRNWSRNRDGEEGLKRRAGRLTRILRSAMWLFFAVSGNLLVCVEQLKARPSTVLAAADHRHSVSLDGEWHVRVDPYGTGLYDFNGRPRNDGVSQNRIQTDPAGLIEYSFAKSPTLGVPGGWDPQREALCYYEGLVWYEKDFDYHTTPGRRVFLPVGAANYRAHLWVNGQALCEHEGGFTGFDCEATRALHDGHNFAVIAVDDTRLPDGVASVRTGWWNYGGITR